MENQDKFLEAMESIKNIAKTQDNRLTQEDIHTYLEGMDLEPEQFQAVYQYLGANFIQVEGYDYKPDPERIAAMQQNAEQQAQEKTAQPKKKKSEDRSAKNRRLYKRELEVLKQYRDELTEMEILRFLQGESELRERIIESRLDYVMDLAGNYKKRMVPKEELIAEGNLGLLEGLLVVEQDPYRYIVEETSVDLASFWGTLEMEAKQAMERLIDLETEHKDQESTMLAKTNLLHEATKYMAEEIGRIPTVEELSEYTKISREEILQITGLSEDTKRVANTQGVTLERPDSFEETPSDTSNVDDDMVKAIFQRRGKRS